MKKADLERFAKAINGLAILYGKDLSGPALETWWGAMQDWPIEEFERVARGLSRTSKFMPLPADFNEVREQADAITAGEAWITARAAAGNAIRHGQFTNDVSCGDPGIDSAVAQIGGYAVIARSDQDKLHFLEKRFAERYGEVKGVERARETLTHDVRPVRLPGLRELVDRKTLK